MRIFDLLMGIFDLLRPNVQKRIERLKRTGDIKALVSHFLYPADVRTEQVARAALIELDNEVVASHLITNSMRDPSLRKRCFSLIVEMGEPTIKALARRMYRYDTSMLKQVCITLGRIGTESALEALTESFKCADPEAFPAIFSALRGFGQTAVTRHYGVLKRAYATCPDTHQKDTLLRTLVDIGGEEWEQELMRVLEENLSDVEVYDPRGYFASDRKPAVESCKLAIDLLARIGTEKGIDRVAHLGFGEVATGGYISSGVRERAQRALRRARAPFAQMYVAIFDKRFDTVKLLIHENPHLRGKTKEILSCYGERCLPCDTQEFMESIGREGP